MRNCFVDTYKNSPVTFADWLRACLKRGQATLLRAWFLTSSLTIG